LNSADSLEPRSAFEDERPLREKGDESGREIYESSDLLVRRK
jgi:hypothetical protein